MTKKSTRLDRLRSVADEVRLYTATGGRFNEAPVIVARLASTGTWWWTAMRRGTFEGCATEILFDMGYQPMAPAWPQPRRPKVMQGTEVEGQSAPPSVEDLEARLGCRLLEI